MNIHNVNWSSKTWSTCSLRFVNMTFWFRGFSVLKASVCVLVFPHIVCINLHRSVSVYRLSIRLYSLLRFFRFTALRVRGVRWISNSVWLRSFHHGLRRCYTEFLRADLCVFHVLVSGMVIRHAFLASRTCQCQFWHFCRPYGFFILLHFSRLFPFFREKCLLHMYIKIWLQFLP